MNSVPPIAYQLRDIHGLDPVPWWPLAPGWWILIGGLLICTWWLNNYLLNRHKQRITKFFWRRDAARQLRTLRRRARRQPAIDSAKELSELLRRIAIARHGRETCAGLTGINWLKWLESQDPAGYAWSDKGKLLLAMPYAPPDTTPPPYPLPLTGEGVLELIDAAREWVKKNQRPLTKKVVLSTIESNHV